MKLAEALVLRADYQRRIEQLKARLMRVARVQEGDAPAENPAALMAELERVAGDLEAMIRRINRVNSTTMLEEGVTLTDALAARDVMRLRQKIYADLAAAAIYLHDRFTRNEVRYVTAVDVAAIQAQADHLARQARELDTRIQAANWLTEMGE
jgi:hypothetical protein